MLEFYRWRLGLNLCVREQRLRIRSLSYTIHKHTQGMTYARACVRAVTLFMQSKIKQWALSIRRLFWTSKGVGKNLVQKSRLGQRTDLGAGWRNPDRDREPFHFSFPLPILHTELTPVTHTHPQWPHSLQLQGLLRRPLKLSPPLDAAPLEAARPKLWRWRRNQPR